MAGEREQAMTEQVGNIGVYSIGAMIPILPLFIIIGVALHHILLVRLDPVLFKEPYFRKKELGVFSAWPFTMIKVLMYMLLIAWPKLAKFKRFKGFDGPLPVGKSVLAMCYIELVLLGLISVGALTMIITGLVVTFAM